MEAELATATERFRASSEHAARTLLLRLEGEADMEATAPIGRLLESVHAEAQRLHLETVVVDLTQLESLSSSGLCCFVTWLTDASELGDGGYRIRMISNKLVPWQRRSLSALACFATDILTIE